MQTKTSQRPKGRTAKIALNLQRQQNKARSILTMMTTGLWFRLWSRSLLMGTLMSWRWRTWRRISSWMGWMIRAGGMSWWTGSWCSFRKRLQFDWLAEVRNICAWFFFVYLGKKLNLLNWVMRELRITIGVRMIKYSKSMLLEIKDGRIKIIKFVIKGDGLRRSFGFRSSFHAIIII